MSWVHYDYHGRNVLFDGDRFVGLFDFDYVGRGTRVIDVGRGLVNFSRAGRGSIESETDALVARQLRPEFARGFLDGYQSVLKVEPEEMRSLPAIAGWSFAPSAYWYTRPYFAGRELVSRFKRDTLLLRTVDSEMRRLAPEFGWAVP